MTLTDAQVLTRAAEIVPGWTCIEMTWGENTRIFYEPTRNGSKIEADILVSRIDLSPVALNALCMGLFQEWLSTNEGYKQALVNPALIFSLIRNRKPIDAMRYMLEAFDE